MGHPRAGVFRRHYMHQTIKVNTKSVYLGTINRADPIDIVGLMSNKRDPRAPAKLDVEDPENADWKPTPNCPPGGRFGGGVRDG